MTRVYAEVALGRDAMRACLAVAVPHARRHDLATLRAIVAERAAVTREPIVILGDRPAREHFPRAAIEAVETVVGMSPGRAAGAIAALAGRAGRLGIRGARWVAEDPELFAAIAGGWCDAARDAGCTRIAFELAVVFADELAPARRVMARLAAETGIAIALGARIETVRGVLARDAIAAVADHVVIDRVALAETCFGLGRDDARSLDAMLAAGLLPCDPFAGDDPAIAALCDGPGLEPPAVVELAGELANGVRARDVLDDLVARVARGELASADALRGFPAASIDALARPVLDDRGRRPLATGLGVAPGAGVGRLARTPDAALALHARGEPVVLVVREVYGDEAAVVPLVAGLVSARGGRTSHAALVAANCGVPCVIDEHAQFGASAVAIGGRELRDGDWLAIDGSTGAIHGEQLGLAPGASPGAIATLLGWADARRRLRVYANADTADAIAAAIANGAEGIGLVRSENMFLEPAALAALRGVLLGARDTAELAALQERGFAVRLAAARGRPITIRLLDASLYELLPHDRDGVARLAAALGQSVEVVAARVDAERPRDPAFALRMSRHAFARPEVQDAQVDALARAWLATPGAAPLSILSPMVVAGAECAALAARIRARVAAVDAAIPVAIGAMIETPRAALDAAAIARAVDFFAWGSNDLTQYTLGLGRSVSLPYADPAATLDRVGVGALMLAAERAARAANPAIRTGVCGNLAADPASIAAFHAIGMDYISVPAAQLPRARVAAARP